MLTRIKQQVCVPSLGSRSEGSRMNKRREEFSSVNEHGGGGWGGSEEESMQAYSRCPPLGAWLRGGGHDPQKSECVRQVNTDTKMTGGSEGCPPAPHHTASN